MSGHAVLAVPVPALEAFVVERTRRYDASFVSRDPAFGHAHVTLLAPWLAAPVEADLTAVAEVLAAEPAFGFTLERVAAFSDGVIHLLPEPSAPFARLTAALAGRFPQTPPYGGRHPDPVPHLTLDHRLTGATERSVAAELADLLPVRATAERVNLQWWDNDDCHVRESWRLG